MAPQAEPAPVWVLAARTWKPGDVARVNGAIAVRADDDQSWFTTAGRLSDPNVAYARPIVVIDPEQREQVERLRDFVDAAHRDHGSQYVDGKGARGNALQTALREYAEPKPQIEEPTGIGAVVETEAHVLCVRVGDTEFPWVKASAPGENSYQWDGYGGLPGGAAIRVLSEGVQP